jgi:pilus assembly protein CpaB
MHSRVLAIIISVVLALVATAALVVYVNGADRRAIAGQQPVQVYVATKLIKAGTSGQDAQNQGLIELRPVARQNVIGETIRTVNQLVDRFAAVDIVPGEQLLRQRWVRAEDLEGRGLLPIPTGHQAVAVELDLTRQVAGFVTPGDSVSLVLSMKRRRPGTQEEPVDRTQVLLHDVRVLAVGTTPVANPNTQNGGRVNQGRGGQTLTAVTFAVRSGDVERVVFAAEYGSIYLTLLAPDPGRPPGGDGRTADDVIQRAQ